VLPFLIYLVAQFGGNAVVYGVLGATYPAFQLIGAPILGKCSDRFGRTSILLLSQLAALEMNHSKAMYSERQVVPAAWRA